MGLLKEFLRGASRLVFAIIFHNPSSGTKGFDKEALLAAIKLANIEGEYISTKNDGFEKAFDQKADLFIAAGGDGTIRKVIIGAREKKVPIAIFPLGTANNVARSLGISGTPQELAETWDLQHAIPFDLGAARGSWGTTSFIESFGVGLVPHYLISASGESKPEGAENLLQGRKLLQKALKKAKPVVLEIIVDGKALKGDFFGVEVLNIPFTGPGLPLGQRADATDRKLDIVCFEVKAKRDLMKWLDAPLQSAPPVVSRRATEVQITWRDVANRLDDKTFTNEEAIQTAELSCEKKPAAMVMPRKNAAQKNHERKAEDRLAT
jgi:diacylglycerol kinase (ATP)